jgi:hypothetical protein
MAVMAVMGSMAMAPAMRRGHVCLRVGALVIIKGHASAIVARLMVAFAIAMADSVTDTIRGAVVVGMMDFFGNGIKIKPSSQFRDHDLFLGFQDFFLPRIQRFIRFQHFFFFFLIFGFFHFKG